jgi:predicted O-methyltransferase YrrM
MKIHPMTGADDNEGKPVALNPYVLAISEDQRKYDLIIIDGVYRNTCAEIALDYLKPGGIIVLDNADQRSIGLNSTSTFKKFAHLKHFSFAQPNHQDWKTDYWKE